ncbi:ornithine cyclodeaminase family protein [Streptosporangium sp. NBC_01756]|uniref:ornithine cyclodeaminase family protein n=1 Tax=Streptosporangium sp. NBC_01756 TaxID=2975950 RepID=UPI002DDA3F2A|nr:ornithine cyclodeaminase family protein [Streptosporangium sp. NBC_01756]WSC87799.1 ornithine cyclodeaminase family protein [Streptosporangium sp. NBC_01756]
MLMITQSDIERLLAPVDYIDLIEDVFAAYARGDTLPSRLAHLDSPPGEFHIKASGLGGVVGVKIGACFYDRPATLGLPSIVGVIVLFDGSNGQPLLFLESATVTRLRTAAATAVAVRHLALPHAFTLAVLGTGAQAASHIEAIRAVRPIERVIVWGRDQAKAGRFAADHGAHLATTPAEAARQADIVVTLTPATQPYLGLRDVRPGTLVAAVGSDAPAKRELHDDLLAGAALITDVTHQCAEVGELHHRPETPVRAELGEIVLGATPGRRNADEIVVYDSTGTAIQDVTAAQALYAAAVKNGAGQPLPLWE